MDSQKAIKESTRRRTRGLLTSPQKYCQFGTTRLPILEENDPSAYRPLEGLPIDTAQQTLINAVWTASTKTQKRNACCSIQYYFSKIMEPPRGKNFSYYGTTLQDENGNYTAGIYVHWSTVAPMVQKYRHKSELTFRFKGFYSFEEACLWVHNNVPARTKVQYEEMEPREGTLLEYQWQEVRRLTEENQHLNKELERLYSLLDNNDFILQQLLPDAQDPDDDPSEEEDQQAEVNIFGAFQQNSAPPSIPKVTLLSRAQQIVKEHEQGHSNVLPNVELHSSPLNLDDIPPVRIPRAQYPDRIQTEENPLFGTPQNPNRRSGKEPAEESTTAQPQPRRQRGKPRNNWRRQQ